ncbi:hypothetical protein AZI86_01705 [Bdellovibrio bacteriovorus]|uniref:Uncharacterized protein n=1 Tax=Bdellovibrio bacteriovorus TaxID=959 RepID=A0A150WN60_BDEBC|nr:KH domain-containing protein [Bdellovibrio bacteriovorus]KYG65814.1 hypothetical protein AZI86_01705 [Bdellovibrio bacteriovorus]
MSAGPAIVIRKRRADKTPDETQVKSDVLTAMQIIFKHLLKCPESATVEISQGEQTTVFEVDLQQNDFGRLLGARGQTINALRILVSGMCAAKGFRAIVKVKDEERFF